MGTGQPSHPRRAAGRAATCRVEQPSTGTIASIAEHGAAMRHGWPAGASPAWPRSTPPATASGPRTWPGSRPRAGPAARRCTRSARCGVSPRTCRPATASRCRRGKPRELRDYLPAEDGRNENATAPVHPAVMSPLLIWALRFTEDFAADILAALAEHSGSAPASPPATARTPPPGSPRCSTSTPAPAPRCPAKPSRAAGLRRLLLPRRHHRREPHPGPERAAARPAPGRQHRAAGHPDHRDSPRQAVDQPHQLPPGAGPRAAAAPPPA